jgi:hypothetical protein
MHHAVRLKVALGTAGRLLRQVAAEIGHIGEVEPGAAGLAVGVLQQDLRAAPDDFEGADLGFDRTLIILCLHAPTLPVVGT